MAYWNWRAVFRHMAEGSALINCGRGQHLNPHDVRQALGQRAVARRLARCVRTGAVARRFAAVWHTPGVWVTPHSGASGRAPSLSHRPASGADNVSRLSAGLGLNNLVDPELGY